MEGLTHAGAGLGSSGTASARPGSVVMDHERAENLILATNSESEKRWKQRKCDYMKKLERDNKDLKDVISEFSQQIGSLKAQNDILHEQLEYFKACLKQMAPIIMNQ